MSREAVATALRVLGTAYSRGLVTARPGLTDVRAYGLEPSEVRWLYNGLTKPCIELAVRGKGVEDVQITGALLRWDVRILLVGRNFAGLLGDLSKELANEAIREYAAAGAS